MCYINFTSSIVQESFIDYIQIDWCNCGQNHKFLATVSYSASLHKFLPIWLPVVETFGVQFPYYLGPTQQAML